MGKEFVVDSLEDMCALMCDNNMEGLEERKMADIELMIKMPHEVYENIKNCKTDDDDVSFAILGIYEGIPLPKGHGRLIDADAITKDLNTFQDAFAINIANGRIIGIACSAPTIIEADKGDKE